VTEPHRLGTAPPARKALTDRLPADVAVAAVEFITGPPLVSPYRAGKRLGDELEGILGARLAREWRVLYEVDEASHSVIVLDIRHRGVAYRAR
jgi:mRNA-degrading endonuclease RelE of RelBE toxin-antitoxin system